MSNTFESRLHNIRIPLNTTSVSVSKIIYSQSTLVFFSSFWQYWDWARASSMLGQHLITELQPPTHSKNFILRQGLTELPRLALNFQSSCLSLPGSLGSQGTSHTQPLFLALHSPSFSPPQYFEANSRHHITVYRKIFFWVYFPKERLLICC
jgi:hypothetical protein